MKKIFVFAFICVLAAASCKGKGGQSKKSIDSTRRANDTSLNKLDSARIVG